MIVLDLFCGEGGAGMGYSRAGFDVVGVDREDLSSAYPFEFHQMDVMDLTPADLALFDAVHASPPCQSYSPLRNYGYEGADEHEDFLDETRELLQRSGLPYVIENVPGAPLDRPMTLCGSMFGLGVRRHRYFEMNWRCTGLRCRHERFETPPLAIYGHFSHTMADARAAMDMPWASRHGLTQAIPPAYTEFIGGQLAGHLTSSS